MAVKAINNTTELNGLIPILLIFGIYSKIAASSPPAPSFAARTNAFRKIIAEMRKIKAKRSVSDALAMRNGLFIINILELPLFSEMKIQRKKEKWTEPHKLFARCDNAIYTIKINGKPIDFRITVVKLYYKDESIKAPILISIDSDLDDSDQNYNPEIATPSPQRRRRPFKSKNKPKINYAYITDKKKADFEFILKLRKKGKIIILKAPFEHSDQTEIEALINCGVFRFEKFDLECYNNIRIFKSRIVHKIKGKRTSAFFEKSRLIIQEYAD